MTERLFRDDAYRLEFEARVLARREHQGRPALVLDRTAFYAESGGQPSDTGTLSGVPVVAVVEDAGEILHVLAGPVAAERVHGLVDGERRRDHREQHHGQHLLSRAFLETAQAATLSFHLGADTCSIDLDRELGEAALRDALRLANEVIWEARPVSARSLTRREADAFGVRAPEEAGDSVRIVEVPGFDLQACGGTHPRSTSEAGVVLIVGSERYKRGCRVRFVCGHRALAAFATRAAALERLGALLSAPLEGLTAAAQRLLEQSEQHQHRSRELAGRAIEAEARRLLAGVAERPALVVATFDTWPAEDLRRLATSLVTLDPCVALLAGRGEDGVQLAFAQSEGLGHDIPGLLREAASLLGGRGGGKGNFAQGRGERQGRLEEALGAAVARIRSHPRSAP